MKTKIYVINSKLSFTRYGELMIFPFSFKINDESGTITIIGVVSASEITFEVNSDDFVDEENNAIDSVTLLDLLSTYCFSLPTLGRAYSLGEQQIGTIEVSSGIIVPLYQQSFIMNKPVPFSNGTYDTGILANRVIGSEAFSDLGVWAIGSSGTDSSGGQTSPSFQVNVPGVNIFVEWVNAPDITSDMYITVKYTKD
jgi:hypothetical protein